MNERLHNILDGKPLEKGDDDLFALPEEKQEFLEHSKLREALRQNNEETSLTSSEKSSMQAAMAAAVGMESAVPAPAPAAVGSAPVSAGRSWYAKGIAALVLGMALGAGLFALIDKNETTVKQVGIVIESTVPSAVPHGFPGTLTGGGCDSVVQELRDSLRMMQQKSIRSGHKKRRKWQPKGELPTTGGNVPEAYRKK